MTALVQIYTGNGIETDRVCKDGAIYPVNGGICFEAQAFPSSLKYSHFAGATVKKNERYFTQTEYRFL